MTGYFYTDPLAAAWMAKHFGMVLIAKWRGSTTWQECRNTMSFFDFSGDDLYFEIHPDSLPLLEPRVGDLIDITESKIGTLARLHDGNLKLFTGDWLVKPDHVYIIRRDGKPFFWPESEEA